MMMLIVDDYRASLAPLTVGLLRERGLNLFLYYASLAILGVRFDLVL